MTRMPALLIALAMLAGCAVEGLQQSEGGGFVPPDTNYAVGGGWQVETVNVVARMFGPNNTVVTKRVGDIVGCGGFISDPHVVYDVQSGRFLMVAVQGFGSPGAWCVAASATSDPTGVWHRVQVFPQKEKAPGTGGTKVNTWPDFPGLGVTPDKIVLTGNIAAGNSFACIQHSGIAVINKADLLAGSPTVRTTYLDPPASSTCPGGPLVFLQPAVHYDAAPSNDAYLLGVNALASPAKKIWAFVVSGVPGGVVALTRSSLPLPPGRYVRLPANAMQKGTAARIQTNDHRVLSVVARGNTVYGAWHQGCTPPTDNKRRSCLRVVLAGINGNRTAWLAQDHRIAEAGSYLFFPAITVNTQGELVAVFNRSSSTVLPQIAISGRRLTDPANTFRPMRVITESPTFYSSPLFRWGDYSGASLDTDGLDTWVAAEYARGTSEWGTKRVFVNHAEFPNP